jgi:C-terminal processing protease CtpA/Prc
LYLRYRKCIEDPRAGDIDDLMGALMTKLEAGGYDRVIFDLRGNGGGNSLFFGGIAGLAWPRRVGRHPALKARGSVIALMDGGTFSSAYLHALQLKRWGAVLVGGPSGQAASNFGEVKTAQLPRGGAMLAYSSKRTGSGQDYHTSLQPDLPVPETIEDHLAARDAALEAALSYPRGR